MNNKAKYAKKGIIVSGSISPGFFEKFVWSVGDLNDTHSENVEEYMRFEPSSLTAFRDLGWTNIKVEKTGERYNRAVRVSGTVKVHKSRPAKTEADAFRIAKNLYKKYTET